MVKNNRHKSAETEGRSVKLNVQHRMTNVEALDRGAVRTLGNSKFRARYSIFLLHYYPGHNELRVKYKRGKFVV